jgi:fatty acid desaturase
MQSVAEPPSPAAPDIRRAIKTLSKVSLPLFLYHLAEVWLVIGIAVYGSAVFLPFSSGVVGVILYVVTVVVIASRQHALMVLTHDGIHKRLSRSLWMNDWCTRLTAAFPVFISLAKWRFIHLYHHQYTHTADDPDRAIYARYPLASKKWRLLLLRDLCGVNILSTLKYFVDIPFITTDFNRQFLGEAREAQYRQIADMRAFVVFWSVMFIVGLSYGGSKAVWLFVLYWLVPYCTCTQVCFRIRGAIEHGNVPDPQNPYQQTRTYFLSPVLGFFFAPKQVNYHLEHHLYPSVPFYNLPRLHALLRQMVYPKEQAYCEVFAAGLRHLIR